MSGAVNEGLGAVRAKVSVPLACTVQWCSCVRNGNAPAAAAVALHSTDLSSSARRMLV